jgi:transposase-like protein
LVSSHRFWSFKAVTCISKACVPKNADRSLLRLSIRVGEIAVRDSRLVRIDERLDGDSVKVCDLATGESSEVSRSSLRGHLAVADGASIDAHLEITRASTGVAWGQAATREQALGALFEGAGSWGQRASDIAKSIGITRRTLYRWLARYRDAAETSRRDGSNLRAGDSRSRSWSGAITIRVARACPACCSTAKAAWARPC